MHLRLCRQLIFLYSGVRKYFVLHHITKAEIKRGMVRNISNAMKLYKCIKM